MGHKKKVNIHLLYCLEWYNSNNYNHWKKEIASFIPELPKIKGTNKYPTEKQLKNWIINDTIEQVKEKINNIIEEAEYEENKSMEKIDSFVAQNYLIEFWNGLANYLANGKAVRVRDVYNKVDELVQKYSEEVI